jgi:hypothetical protein
MTLFVQILPVQMPQFYLLLIKLCLQLRRMDHMGHTQRKTIKTHLKFYCLWPINKDKQDINNQVIKL